MLKKEDLPLNWQQGSCSDTWLPNPIFSTKHKAKNAWGKTENILSILPRHDNMSQQARTTASNP